ncbi:hypothetical protein KR018_006514, partial [Drosophila ironensis]
LKFNSIAKGEVRQDCVADFVAIPTHDEFIALSSSKTDVITLELTPKASALYPFPYTVASSEMTALDPRPLDALANQVDLQSIYDGSHVLDAQQLALETVYSAVCSGAVPAAVLRAVKKANRLLADGTLLLGVLDTHGSLTLMGKPVEWSRWSRFEALKVPETLRDKLIPKVNASTVDSFSNYQAFIDPAWITMFAWQPEESEVTGPHILVLGTASGDLWVLTLSNDARTLIQHTHLSTDLDRICFMDVFEDLLLVGDEMGLVNLYRLSKDNKSAPILVRSLWATADRMGLQMGVITRCPETKCHYITCCKAAHLLTWCLKDEECLETRLYVGGVKITALCRLDSKSYAVGTANSELKIVKIEHKHNELKLDTQPVAMEDLQDFQVMGFSTSRHRNLLTVLLYRNKEYMHVGPALKNQVIVQVGQIGEVDALACLEESLKPDEPINHYIDYLVELRVNIFSQKNLESYENFQAWDSLDFSGPATDHQQEQLQLKFHILSAILELHSHNLQVSMHAQKSEDNMQLLLAMLSFTHIRLRLQFLGKAKKLSEFQGQAVKSLLAEAQRQGYNLRESRLHGEDHPLKSVVNTFLQQMDEHFVVLHEKFGEPEKSAEEPSVLRCSISYLKIPLSIERRYCSLCDRQVLMELQDLQQLFDPPPTQLLCPFCHGSYSLELFAA